MGSPERIAIQMKRFMHQIRHASPTIRRGQDVICTSISLAKTCKKYKTETSIDRPKPLPVDMFYD